MSPALRLLAAETIHWIRVDKPVFDLVGVVLYSLGLAAICAVVALLLGSAFGIALIVRNRRQLASVGERGLQLLEP
jgi:hypothetical protein